MLEAHKHTYKIKKINIKFKKKLSKISKNLKKNLVVTM